MSEKKRLSVERGGCRWRGSGTWLTLAPTCLPTLGTPPSTIDTLYDKQGVRIGESRMEW